MNFIIDLIGNIVIEFAISKHYPRSPIWRWSMRTIFLGLSSGTLMNLALASDFVVLLVASLIYGIILMYTEYHYGSKRLGIAIAITMTFMTGAALI